MRIEITVTCPFCDLGIRSFEVIPNDLAENIIDPEGEIDKAIASRSWQVRQTLRVHLQSCRKRSSSEKGR